METENRYCELVRQLLCVGDNESIHAPLGSPGFDPMPRKYNAGDLSDVYEQKLAVKVLSLLPNVNDTQWARLGEAERIPWLELAVAKMAPETPAAEQWSIARSPTEWQKELKISGSTWQRRVRDKELIVDKITVKSVRIRLDSLEKFKPAK